MRQIRHTQRNGRALPANGRKGAPRPFRNMAFAGIFNVLALVLLLVLPLNPATAAEKTLLVLGDSLTAGYGLPAKDSFPAQLEAALRAKGHDIKVINGGVSGDTTAGGLARLDWLMAETPDFAIVALGANDGLRALDPARSKESLDAIIKKLKGKGVPVLLAGMLAPPNLGKEYGDDFNAIFPALAEKHDVAFYPFFLDGVAAEQSLNQADGIHPNARGVAVMVERMLPMIGKLIAGGA